MKEYIDLVKYVLETGKIKNNRTGTDTLSSFVTHYKINLSNGLIFVEYENETLPKKFRKIEKLIFSTKF